MNLPSNHGGGMAEAKVEDFLIVRGFKVLERNWKTRACEIDVVARKGDCLYFVEVKYRENSAQGEGFDYMTAKKLSQMEFAARYYVAAKTGTATTS